MLLKVGLQWGTAGHLDLNSWCALRLTSHALHQQPRVDAKNPFFNAVFIAQNKLRELEVQLAQAPDADKPRIAGLRDQCARDAEAAVNRAIVCRDAIRQHAHSIERVLQLLDQGDDSLLPVLSREMEDCGHFEEAIRCQELAIKLEPGDPLPHYYVEIAENCLRAGKPQAAVELLEAMHSPAYFWARLNVQNASLLADALNHLGRHEEALKVLDAAPAAHYQGAAKSAAVALHKLGRPEDCRSVLEALNHDPMTKARAYVAMGMVTQALACIDQGLAEDDPGRDELRKMLLSPEVLRSPARDAIRNSETWGRLVARSRMEGLPAFHLLELGNYPFRLPDFPLARESILPGSAVADIREACESNGTRASMHLDRQDSQY